MSDTCNCCDGLARITPESRYNRPGLAALTYRVGTYAIFLETMLARLTTLDLSDDPAQILRPLLDLTTRELDDPSIALLDAWAVLADVLTFYQERLANEGYLRTARERRSILELGRLVGYEMRRGVAASVFLAFTVEDPDPQKPILIPAGTRVQSLPKPGELPQPFETSEDLEARVAWNAMRPRLSQVQDLSGGTNLLYLAGTGLNLKDHDPILVIDSADKKYLRFVHQIKVQPEQNQTLVFLSGELNLAPLIAQQGISVNETSKTNLPSVISPADGAVDAPINPILMWTKPTGNPILPNFTRFVVKWRRKVDQVWQNEYVNYDPDEPEFSKTLTNLSNETDYQWQVNLQKQTQNKGEQDTKIEIDPCANGRPIWTFTTAKVDTFSNLAVERDTTGQLTQWIFSWKWNGVEPDSFTITLDYTDDSENTPQPITVNGSATSKTSELDLPDSFTWQITAYSGSKAIGSSGEQSYPPPSPGNSNTSGTIDAGAAKAAANAIINLVKTGSQQLNYSLTQTIELLKDRSTPTKADAYVKIIQTPLPYLEPLLRELGKFSPNHDFGCHIDWLTETITGLDEIIKNLNVVRMTASRERVFPNEFVTATDELKQLIEAKIQSRPVLPGNLLNPIVNQILAMVANQIQMSLNELEDVTDPDSQVRLVKQLVHLLQMLEQIINQLPGLSNITNVRAWLSQQPNQNNSNELGLIQILERFITNNRGTAALDNQLISSLLKLPSRPPANRLALDRDISDIFDDQKTDIIPHLLTALNPQLEANLYRAWAKTSAQPAELSQSAQIFRIQAAPFGAKAMEKVFEPAGTNNNGSPKYTLTTNSTSTFQSDSKKIILDSNYKEIKPGGWVVIQWPEGVTRNNFEGKTSPPDNPLYRRALKVDTISKETYGQLTLLELDEAWIHTSDTLEVLRSATVYVQSEVLPLTDEPIVDDIKIDALPLDALYEGLTAGQWLLVSGERTDIPGASGVRYSELVMIKKVAQRLQELEIGGDRTSVSIGKVYTELTLTTPLAYTYKRDTVTIYGNVVKATHGETRQEVLGHGDGSQVRQAFTLKQPPLTYLAAPTRKGVESTLEVRVNNIRWPEKENLLELGPDDRGYVTRTDNEQNTTIIFGDGLQGKRLPTGVENIKAVYRNGLGQTGNVAAEQISQLSTRPLGVKGVINPLPASGGADRETADQARWNVPRALLALDRLVSVSDYEDFARTFAGISKASAAKLFEGRQEVIHLSIAGVDDGSIAQDSDLYRALFDALERYGTLQLPLRIESRKLKLLVIIANVKIHPDYLWETIEPQLRAVLLATFSFERREIGQNALVSEAISVMQQVRGVEYVDIDIFTSISEDNAVNPDKLFQKLRDIANLANTNTGVADVKVNRADDSGDQIKPAEIAYLNPAVPDTLILKEIKG